MNKAFVREPESIEARCPRCGSLGTAVGIETLTAFVRPERMAEIAKAAFFCDYWRCEVAYFDQFERVLTTHDLVRPVWPKDHAAPICGCFGLTADDVEADVRAGEVARVKSVVRRAAGPEANCIVCSPSGHACTSEVQRYYFKLRSQQSPT